MPLPYRRVSVQSFEGSITPESLLNYFIGKEAFMATDYIVVKGQGTAVLQIEKEKKQNALFSKIISIDVIASPNDCLFVVDDRVDVANPSQITKKFFDLNLKEDNTLVVEGAYGHVNFIHRPAPLHLKVIDLVPPSSSRLYDLVLKALELADLPPILLQADNIDVNDIAKKSGHTDCIFPCRASGLKASGKTFFLDEHPEESELPLIGCERTEQIYEHFYKTKPQRIETCPQKLKTKGATAEIMRCCLLQDSTKIEGLRGIIPWGGNVHHVISILEEICKNSKIPWNVS